MPSPGSVRRWGGVSWWRAAFLLAVPAVLLLEPLRPLRRYLVVAVLLALLGVALLRLVRPRPKPARWWDERG